MFFKTVSLPEFFFRLYSGFLLHLYSIHFPQEHFHQQKWTEQSHEREVSLSVCCLATGTPLLLATSHSTQLQSTSQPAWGRMVCTGRCSLMRLRSCPGLSVQGGGEVQRKYHGVCNLTESNMNLAQLSVNWFESQN